MAVPVPTPDEELDSSAAGLHQDLFALAEVKRVAEGYRGTEADYRMLAEQQEAKLPALRAAVRAKLAALRP